MSKTLELLLRELEKCQNLIKITEIDPKNESYYKIIILTYKGNLSTPFPLIAEDYSTYQESIRTHLSKRLKSLFSSSESTAHLDT